MEKDNIIFRIIRSTFANDSRFFKFKKYFYYKIGLYAETLVIVFMFFKGYKLIKHRYNNYCGEIDLILCKGKTIVFVEVKTRTTEIDYFAIVSSNQKRRIIKSSEVFLAKYKKYNKHFSRFDICIVNSILPWKIHHIQNVWGI